MIKNNKTYNWNMDINLLKNFFFFLTLWEIFLLISGVIPALLFFLDLVEGNFSFKSIITYFKAYMLIASILTAVLLFSYFIVFIPIIGLKYRLTFEMDEKGINHIVREGQKKTNRNFAFFGMLAGIITKNLGVAGANMLAYSRQNMYTSFIKVKKVIYYRKRRIIKLIGFDLTRNVIFTTKDNSEAVFNYICEHSCNATIIQK